MKLLSTMLLAISLGLGCVTNTIAEPKLADSTAATLHAGQKTPASKNLTKKQLELLAFAHEVALQDGHKYPQYVQGIMMQESKAGELDVNWRVAGTQNKPSDRYFGIGQIKLAAAKAVMQAFPIMWALLNTRTDEELQARLILDDRFNIRVISKYALLMGMNANPAKGITAYNRGLGGAQSVDPDTYGYTLSVKQKAYSLKNITKVGMVIESTDDKYNSLAPVDDQNQ